MYIPIIISGNLFFSKYLNINFLKHLLYFRNTFYLVKKGLMPVSLYIMSPTETVSSIIMIKFHLSIFTQYHSIMSFTVSMFAYCSQLIP